MSLDPKRWKGSCSARCADTGRRCALPHHTGEHADGKHRFTRVAAPGQTYFPLTAELAERAFSRAAPVIEETRGAKEMERVTLQAKRARARAAEVDLG